MLEMAPEDEASGLPTQTHFPLASFDLSQAQLDKIDVAYENAVALEAQQEAEKLEQ